MPPATGIALVVCDNVYQDRTGKRALVGLFDRILATEFPAIHFRMCVFVAITSIRPQTQCMLRIVDGETDDVVVEMVGTVPADSPTDICDMVFELQPIGFPQAGTYFVQFWSQNTLLMQRPFEVINIRPSEP